MGYDLHVTRADHWTHSEGREISSNEWHELVTKDPELRPDAANGPYSAEWLDAKGQVRGWFDWFSGAVYTTDPNRDTVGKLLDLAGRLEARLQGDDGEFYESAEEWKRS